MKVLAICRPRVGTEPAELTRLVADEVDHLEMLREGGTLLEAYRPGGPGAVLILEAADLDEAQSAVRALPLAAAGLIDAELIILHPLRY
jgi:hypothetical protein